MGPLMGAVLMLSLVALVPKASADAMVTGTVFCDQCKDGRFSFFDYPLYGARVAVSCIGADRATSAYKEGSTSWTGSYAMRLDGRTADLSRCYARVIGGPSGCGASAGPAQRLNLMFNMFGMPMYNVVPLLSQPQQPMAFCPRSSPPSPAPWLPSPSPPARSRYPHAPKIPFLQASACSYDKWTMPEYKCYWKLVGPDTKVAIAFGPVAAGKYGTNMSLFEALHGRGDTYRTLLREATTALLNSYNSLQFSYPTMVVIDHMNRALLGSTRQALMTALRFKRANTGVSGHIACNFSRCS